MLYIFDKDIRARMLKNDQFMPPPLTGHDRLHLITTMLLHLTFLAVIALILCHLSKAYLRRRRALCVLSSPSYTARVPTT